MGKTIFETEHLVEFDDDGLPVKTARMTFNLDELALIRSGLNFGTDQMISDGYPEGRISPVVTAARAFFDAEAWVRGAGDCE
ncbi:hypothetical protein [Arthrobacter sp. 31Y]|uniref:hypothetical protein n=1 Tax=Arthrobacter sp. 31Y TaxID=1115632 RepID=UPI00046551B9|nr:hypothetical protein [Arthrobacter sp. 31Y]